MDQTLLAIFGRNRGTEEEDWDLVKRLQVVIGMNRENGRRLSNHMHNFGS